MNSVSIIQLSCIFLFLSVSIRVHPWFRSYFQSRPEAGEDCQGGFFGALASLAYGAYARGASIFAGACGDQLARFCEQDVVRAVQRLGKSNSAGICVVEI
jgi:hypothetical protein